MCPVPRETDDPFSSIQLRIDPFNSSVSCDLVSVGPYSGSLVDAYRTEVHGTAPQTLTWFPADVETFAGGTYAIVCSVKGDGVNGTTIFGYKIVE